MTALDIITPANFYTASWTKPHLLARATGPGSTKLGNATGSITADAVAPGAAPGSAAIAPDTMNGGLAVTFTPPTSSDTWRVGAKIEVN